MAARDKSTGLTCPSCAGVVPVPEGARVVQCPFCEMRSLVAGDQGVRRWQVARRVEREKALEQVQRFFSGLNRARDLKKEARIREMFLVYLPYWRVQALVAGWMLGRERKDKDSTRPVEIRIQEEMLWNDAATDVAEFGVHRVPLDGLDLEPYDEDTLHLEGMIFEPSESPTDAMHEAEQHFLYRARSKKSLTQKFYEKIHILRPLFSVVYYPLWVARYEYKQRNYQVVVDGVNAKVLYGKAPGNIFYRAAMLVAGMALGNLSLVNGTILTAMFLSESSDDDSALVILAPIALGIFLIIAGYRAFRYGEEVEERPGEAKKARLAGDKQFNFDGGNLLEQGMKIMREIEKYQ